MDLWIALARVKRWSELAWLIAPSTSLPSSDHFPTELSGGEQQRVAVARALINNPALILADEPTGNLDANAANQVMYLLQSLQDEGRTILLVTHDPAVAAYASREILLRDGSILSARGADSAERARRGAI